ncbi:MAG TPA: 3-deoxy-manno-octulosonate cytidylyltransferase [Candidatus Kapabacteria bacterium]|nr:3-deoxy-manno-octulosonate cytidylyltransferase [Candidatus Kapabacteria bacterium]
MKTIALIPARYNSTRFPGKLMANLGGKTVIRRTYEQALNMNLFHSVYVITDSEIIFDEINSFGGHVIKSKGNYETGTDRIAEVAKDIDADIFINIQGDEPFISSAPIHAVISQFENSDVQVCSLVQVLNDINLINNPNYVKVVLDNHNNALYFSRSPIPYLRDNYILKSFYEHIGVYAFRKEILMQFAEWEQSELEMAEKIEALRFLENGIRIKMLITEHKSIEIDTKEDLDRAKEYLEKFIL